MLFELAEFGRFVGLSGFETRPEDVDSILRAALERFSNVSLQLVDLDKVAGSRFLLLATFNAIRSFQSKQPISRTLGMEILLYLSGEQTDQRSGETRGHHTRNKTNRHTDRWSLQSRNH